MVDAATAVETAGVAAGAIALCVKVMASGRPGPAVREPRPAWRVVGSTRRSHLYDQDRGALYDPDKETR